MYSSQGLYKLHCAISSSIPTFLDCAGHMSWTRTFRISEPCLHQTLQNGFQCWHDVQLTIYKDAGPPEWVHHESEVCICVFNRWRTSWARRSCSLSFPRIWVLVRVPTRSRHQVFVNQSLAVYFFKSKWTYHNTWLRYLHKKWNQLCVVASSGGSVEGYCAGEKEVLDAFNKWVSHRRQSWSMWYCSAR